MTCAWITHSLCHLHEMGHDHPECPERLDAISDHLLAQGLLNLTVPYDAPEATIEQLERAHTARHVTEILAASPTEGYVHVDPDTAMNPHTTKAALRAAGAVVLATDLVLKGEVNTALFLTALVTTLMTSPLLGRLGRYRNILEPAAPLAKP